MAIDLDQVTEFQNEKVFIMTEFPHHSYEKDYNAKMDVTLGMNLDVIEIRRQHYEIVQLLSDVGGMQGILVSVFAFLISIWNYKMFDNNMVCNLYKLERQSEIDTRHIKDTFKESDYMKPRQFFNPKEYFRDALPSRVCFCRGCKPDRLERGF